ncbi:hypothetical protein ATE67_01790 [Sphingopyxis sp. H050]|jgi:hypothetical protein|uniref:anti-sigma factor family protein n=1 Tax=Sphingopyxis sp. H050 TaxID=1759072 RepID=UPI00073639D0|nr:hypothetical protein [Sphingopyxis sp. H050]KTE22688.1 hypothetical protein ATE67_01790 [Sphingopyxis sp. H050]
MSFDPATVAAYVDGELDDLTARRIEREAETDTALAAEIVRHRALKAQLAAHFAPIAEEPVPERLRALLATRETVDTSLAARREAKRWRLDATHWGAMAAALVLGITVGTRPWAPTPNVATSNGTLIAAGPLAEALDTQLASNQPAGADVRIGLSFADKDGRFCRSFESATLDGIGCRKEGRWQLERTLQGQAGSDYRQASSGELAAAASAMMAGDPLDADAERAARDGGWRKK